MLEEEIKSAKLNVRNGIKSRIFDIIAVGVILAMMAVSLGVFKFKDVTRDTIIALLIDFVPLLLTAALLTSNFYKKGTFIGKMSEQFISTANVYSNIVASLDGRQIDSLPDFCNKYNGDALKSLQIHILNKVAISYDLYNDGNENSPPLKTLSRKELKLRYSNVVRKAIIAANKCKVKGLRVNNLLGSQDSSDITDIGPSERRMEIAHNASSTAMYIISTGFMTLIAMKDVLTWGWSSLILVSFKLLYVLTKSYMSYFTGYNDITVSLNNSITRKTDIIKQFKYWYENKFIETDINQNPVIK